MDLKELHSENERVWDIVARSKYARDVDVDVALLKGGGISLMSHDPCSRSRLGAMGSRHRTRGHH